MSGIRPRHVTPLELGTLAAALGASVHPAAEAAAAVTVTGVDLDSRTVAPGDLYAALPGANVHGARFARGAQDGGAVAVLTDTDGARLARASGSQLPVIVVPDPRASLGTAAALIYGTRPPGLDLIGVTGTNGKTTTTYLLDSALRALGHRVGLIGTVETRIGRQRVKSVRTTPEASEVHALIAAMREGGVDTCVMEVSSHALSLHRVDGLAYDVAVFTNLSQDHLDHHRTMENYFRAKAALFTPERARRAVVCVDDAWGRRLVGEAGIPLVTLSSTGAPADWRLTGAAGEAEFTLSGPEDEWRLRSALPGDFNRVNTALAAVALHELGAAGQEVCRAVRADPHVPGRMEKVTPTRPGPPAPLAVVDYAHTPDAVAAALAALRPAAVGGPVVVVLGAGGDRDRGKRHDMGAAAAAGADVVIVTDDNPRSEDPVSIRAEVLAGARNSLPLKDVREVADRRDAIRIAVEIAAPAGAGAVVAVVGKGHESGQEIAGQVHPFDDRTELAVALDAVLGGGAA